MEKKKGRAIKLKIAIMGVGALGGYFGGRWQEAGADVSYIVRPKRAEQLEENGLILHSVKGDYEVPHLNIIQTGDTGNMPRADIVFLAVKGYHLEGTLPVLKELTEKGAKVLPVLNGIEHLDILKKELGEEAVIGGLVYIIATLDDKGHVVHTSDIHNLVFGPLHPSQEDVCSQLQQLNEKANLTGVQSEDILTELWNKYMFITAFSGVTAAGNFPIGTVRSHPASMDLIQSVLEEMKQLAHAHGIELTETHIGQAMEKFRTFPDEATSSMHQDRRKGLTIEVEHLLGGALRLGRKKGANMPHVETLYALLKPYENS